MKRIGIFQNAKGEWIVGKDVNNGGVCDTREHAEQLLALHKKYYWKRVQFTLKGKPVVGRVTEVGLTWVTRDGSIVEPNLYIRYKFGKYKVPEVDCTIVPSKVF